MTVIHWTEDERDEFARRWPCCDVPAEGWVELAGPYQEIVDISLNTGDCQPSGGLKEFICDLQDKFITCEKCGGIGCRYCCDRGVVPAENQPCRSCNRNDLPLHFNRQCPECFDETQPLEE